MPPPFVRNNMMFTRGPFKAGTFVQERIQRMERDAAAYLQLMEAKDESIVRLTNQLHEVELQAKIDQV